MHMHAQYGHVITNYAAILAITLAIWTEKPWNLKHDSSFWEGLFEMQSIYQVWYFSLQPCPIKRRPAKDLHCSDSFWIFYASFKLWSKRRAWRFLARGWVSPNLHWISNKTAYCESKNDFCKKSWAYDNVHVVQIGPTSYQFGRHLSFSSGVDRKVLDTPVGTFVNVRWSIILEKCGAGISKLSFGGWFTKRPVFCARKIENGFSVRRQGKLSPATLFAIPWCTCMHNMGTLSQTMSRFYP